jgi:hypothetical protein
MFFEVVIHTLKMYEKWNQGYQWNFPQAYDGRGKLNHYSNG